MQGFGIGFFGCLESEKITPTATANIQYVSLSSAKFDYLYISRNTEWDSSFVWDKDTSLWAKFNNSTVAGNSDYTLSTVSDMLIKKRKLGEFNWRTVSTKKIKTISDFDIIGYDYLSAFDQDYQYAVVGSLNGVEANYNIKDIKSSGDSFYIIDKNNVYGTYTEQGSCDTTRNDASSIIELPYRSKPIQIRCSTINYDSGTMSGLFLKYNSKDCSFETAGLQKYRREVLDFLSNGNQKILKLPDGRMWLISVNNKSITDTMNGHRDFRTIAFGWTETGDCESDKALYYAGLTNVTSEYWNS